MAALSPVVSLPDRVDKLLQSSLRQSSHVPVWPPGPHAKAPAG